MGIITPDKFSSQRGLEKYIAPRMMTCIYCETMSLQIILFTYIVFYLRIAGIDDDSLHTADMYSLYSVLVYIYSYIFVYK